MNINKAIRKQKKSFVRFMLTSGFVFFVLPMVLILSGNKNMFFVVYLVIIEIMITILVLRRIDNEYLRFYFDVRLNMELGLQMQKYSINPEKVVYVDVKNSGNLLNIIIILKSNLRNPRIKKLEYKIISEYPNINNFLKDIIIENIENNYHYLIIDKGGFYKYKLLDLIYRSCVRACFSSNAISKLKEYRT